jgi:hypothetical protein
MKRALILVEGQTEERFVKQVLLDHLVSVNVGITPTLLTTKVVKSGPNFKGGVGCTSASAGSSRGLKTSIG